MKNDAALTNDARKLANEARDAHDTLECEEPCKLRMASTIDRLCDENEALRKAQSEMLRGIQTEIGAGKTFENGEVAAAHNNACDRAIRIIQNYRDGYGLFQRAALANADTERKG